MPNLQNWLNAWVKVNARHVVEAPEANGKAHYSQQDPSIKTHDSSVRTVTESTQSTNSNAGSGTPPPTDPELLAIRKFNNRKHKRRLHRTNSFSDLIREKAKQRDNNGRSGQQSQYRSQQQRQQQQQQPPPQQQHHHRPAPPSLHYKETAPPSSYISERDSAHSSSPTETVQTVQRSNLRRHQHHLQPQGYEADDSYVEDNSSTTSHSALWGVAGFFGADISSEEFHIDQRQEQHQQQTQPQSLKQTLDTQHGQRKEQPHYLRSYNRLPTSSRIRQQQQQQHQEHFSNPPKRQQHQRQRELSSRQSHPLVEVESQQKPETGILVGGVRLPFFSTTSSSADSNNNNDNSNNNPFGGKAGCAGCKAAEAELQHAQESLEYMRGMAIRKEYCCPKCGADASQNKPATPSVVKTASQQLVEVTARHKKQVEQLMKERNHWQRNMHLKLEKFANLCRNMNNESSSQSEKAHALQEELEQTRRERDEMAGELEKMRADAQVYEKEREEYRQLQQTMREYENQGLNQAEEAIAMRDDMIAKLSARLDTTLETLSMEREQQRQRRQIIFPPSTRNGGHHVQNKNHGINGSGHPPYSYGNNNGEIHNSHNQNHKKSSQNAHNSSNNSYEEEVTRLREQLLETQRKLESTQLEAKQRETALLFKCDTLETRLNRATVAPASGNDSSSAPQQEQQHHRMDDSSDGTK